MSELLLTKEQIKNRLFNRQLVVEPMLDIEQIDVASVDIRLDNFFVEFKTAKKPYIDPATIGEEYQEYLDYVELECMKDFYYLQPKRFILARTFEYIGLPSDAAAHLDGRTSVARQGLTVHAAAGLIDPGFRGHLVFELLNAGEMPIKLYPLMRVAKLSFYKAKKTAPYSGPYNIQVRIRRPDSDKDCIMIKNLTEKNCVVKHFSSAE